MVLPQEYLGHHWRYDCERASENASCWQGISMAPKPTVPSVFFQRCTVKQNCPCVALPFSPVIGDT